MSRETDAPGGAIHGHLDAIGSKLAERRNEPNREQELRAFCGRLFGFTSRHAERAAQALLDATERSATVTLRGACDLVPIAYSLHRRLFGPGQKFIAAHPRRNDSDGNVRSSPARNSALSALDAAAGGSVCIDAKRLPGDFEAFAEQVQAGRRAAMVFICLHDRQSIRDFLCPPLDVPSLSTRRPELDRVLIEYLEEAAIVLGAPTKSLPPKARGEIIANIASISEIEKTALRLVALTTEPSLPAAAHLLGMADASLSRWVARRSWLLNVINDLHGHAGDNAPSR
jgi:hypothetical protein